MKYFMIKISKKIHPGYVFTDTVFTSNKNHRGALQTAKRKYPSATYKIKQMPRSWKPFPGTLSNPLSDKLKAYAKRGASYGLNKLNEYAQKKLKNPQARATYPLISAFNSDPFIYQRVYSPTAQSLLHELLVKGRFDRRRWIKKLRLVADQTARTLTRATGRIATRAEKLRFAALLAHNLWKTAAQGRN